MVDFDAGNGTMSFIMNFAIEIYSDLVWLMVLIIQYIEKCSESFG